MAFAYEWFLDQPVLYTAFHTLSETAAGIAALPFLAMIIWDYTATDSYLTRQRIRVIFLGFLGSLAFPAILMQISGLTRGGVTVNYAAFTIFLFPLSLGYAIVKPDLFEIDAFVKRGVFYLALTAVITTQYTQRNIRMAWQNSEHNSPFL